MKEVPTWHGQDQEAMERGAITLVTSVPIIAGAPPTTPAATSAMVTRPAERNVITLLEPN